MLLASALDLYTSECSPTDIRRPYSTGFTGFQSARVHMNKEKETRGVRGPGDAYFRHASELVASAPASSGPGRFHGAHAEGGRGGGLGARALAEIQKRAAAAEGGSNGKAKLRAGFVPPAQAAVSGPPIAFAHWKIRSLANSCRMKSAR